VTRARRQTEPPCGDVPRKRRDDGGKHCGHCDNVRVHQTFTDRRCHCTAEQRAGEIKKPCHRDSLTRCENFCRNDSRNRIGGVMKAIAVFEDDRCDYDDEKRKHSRGKSELRILQRHFKDDVSRVPATVDDLFDQCEQIAQKNHLLRFIIALVKIA